MSFKLLRTVCASRAFSTASSKSSPAVDALPSFSRALFAGALSTASVHPYPPQEVMGQEQRETLRMLVEPTRQFFTEVNDAAFNDESASIPEKTLKGLRELGAYGMQVPEEYGGLGLGNGGYARLGEVMGEFDLGLGIHLGAHQSIGFKGILLFGTPEQKRKYLPALASGEQLAAFALTEPSVGSDANSVTTRAVLSADGATWHLTGGKLWISNGGMAEVFTVFAQTSVPDTKNPGQMVDRVTAFIVERSFGGLTHGPPEKKLGIKCSNTAEVYLDACPVPAANVLGEVGGGFKVAMEILNNGRFGMGAALTGTMKGLLAGVREHALSRSQFGKKIGEYGVIREKLAGIAARIYGAESLAYMLASNMDRGMGDYMLEAACGKVYASDAAWWSADEAIQVMGGLGFMKSLPYERVLRDLRIFRIFEGTNDILKLMVAGSGLQTLGKELTAVAKGGPAAQLPFAWRLAQARFLGVAPTAPTLPWAPPPLRSAAAIVEAHTAAFGDAAAGLVLRYKKGLIDQQLALRCTAEVCIDLTVCTAALSRAARAVAARGAAGAAGEVQLASLLVHDASVRMAVGLAAMQAHAKPATGSTVAVPAPNMLELERLKNAVAEGVLKEGYTAEPPLGF